VAISLSPTAAETPVVGDRSTISDIKHLGRRFSKDGPLYTTDETLSGKANEGATRLLEWDEPR